MSSIRTGTLNIPLDAAKLPDGPRRAKEAARQINGSNLAVVALQELDRSPGSTSHKYADLLLKELGSEWSMVKPTTAYNENYLFYRPKVAKLVKQHADTILTSNAGGRHATRAEFTIGGEQLTFISTHLVHGSLRGSAREQQAKQLNNISTSRTIILGDLNQKAVPKGLAARFSTARTVAKASTNAGWGTYAKYTAKKPSKTAGSFLDHVLVPKDFRVNGYTLVGITNDLFTKPRASDHLLVIVSLSLPEKLDQSVKKLQQRLTALGFLLGKVDGVDGPKTRDAVKRFQRAWNLGAKLTVDGVAGRLTLAALNTTEARGGRLSENFKASELRCKCGGKYSNCLGVLAYRDDLVALENLRKRVYPKGLRIVSAYRCASHNRSVGGASASMHLSGKAYDIPAVVNYRSSLIPSRFRGRGYDRNKRARHVDSRTSPANWSY